MKPLNIPRNVLDTSHRKFLGSLGVARKAEGFKRNTPSPNSQDKALQELVCCGSLESSRNFPGGSR